MAASQWEKFPNPVKAHAYPGDALKKNWERLHRGDCEPFPADEAVQDAWRLYHHGDFHVAYEKGISAGSVGHIAAAKSICIYADHLESDAARKLELFQEAADLCEALQAGNAKNANAFYLYALAMGRYSQGISIVKALAQGIGGKVKTALDKALQLAPKHADAYAALGSYHAEIVEKVGAMVGRLTYGVSKDASVKHYETSLELAPNAPICYLEYAKGLKALYGRARREEVAALYEKAIALKPLDAMDALDIRRAKRELDEG